MSIAAFLAIEEGGFSSTISLGHILCLGQFCSPLFLLVPACFKLRRGRINIQFVP